MLKNCWESTGRLQRVESANIDSPLVCTIYRKVDPKMNHPKNISFPSQRVDLSGNKRQFRQFGLGANRDPHY